MIAVPYHARTYKLRRASQNPWICRQTTNLGVRVRIPSGAPERIRTAAFQLKTHPDKCARTFPSERHCEATVENRCALPPLLPRRLCPKSEACSDKFYSLISLAYWSERRDLNSRPPVPQTGALTRLRHAPCRCRGGSWPRGAG